MDYFKQREDEKSQERKRNFAGRISGKHMIIQSECGNKQPGIERLKKIAESLAASWTIWFAKSRRSRRARSESREGSRKS